MSRPAGPPAIDLGFLLVGRATRLPGKFFLPVDGEPILRRAERALRSAGFSVTVVSVGPLDLPGVPVVRDRYGAGPLGGLATVLETGAERFFLAGGDMPHLDPASLRTLREEFDGRTLVPTRQDGTWEVLHAIYSGVDPRAVRNLLAAGGGLRDLVLAESREGRVRFLPPGRLSEASFTDLDTPEDYAREFPREARGPSGRGRRARR